jgi:non-ribosomal peptide synthetase component F
LLRRLKLVRDPSRPPLVSVVFNLDGAAHDLRFDDLVVAVDLNPAPLAKFDLFLNLIIGSEEIEAECIYSVDLFEAATVSAWLGTFRRLLELVVTDPEVEIATLFGALEERRRREIDQERSRMRRIYQDRMSTARRRPVPMDVSTTGEA